ncbi:hypothetical protein [Metabacillus litoralis]|uniref:hypothetical protein n=1 Tax=Metabacillus litoralis TaxID=152268 RepID=UPI00203C83EB|nr:hypothetical protein [Metabacillus litoralis]MCM3410321.1 hypothetical protein [Metabacillus litoralis]
MDILFLIVSLLLLSLITGMRMLISVWGKKYRYTTAWNLVDSKNERKNVRKRAIRKYGR